MVAYRVNLQWLMSSIPNQLLTRDAPCTILRLHVVRLSVVCLHVSCDVSGSG